MDALRAARQRRGLSQREFASRAGLSFRGVQLLEKPDHDPRLSSLARATRALGLPASGPRLLLRGFLSLHPDSVRATGLRILADGPESWTIHLFDFVDAFRRAPEPELVREPVDAGSERFNALIAATVEVLCEEAELPAPHWCAAMPSLAVPWFVSGIENLKASALAESPVPFRRRNVFVLGNFLERA